MRFRGAIGVAALLALGLPAAAHAGSLVVIGGGLEDPAIYDEIVRLGGGPGVARIGILTTGSGTPEKNGRFYLDAFAGRGAEAEWIPLEIGDPKRANDPALVAQARGCNVFFLGGGDQQRYTATLLRKDGSDTALLAAIRQAFEAGGVVAGTSAGAAALVEGPMVTGGESYEALGRASGVSDRQRGGLRFFRFGLIDTHFAERGRQGRLIRLAARRRVGLAFGVDEDAALVVEDAQGQRPRMRVVGRGGVSVFDLSSARAPARGRWSGRAPIARTSSARSIAARGGATGPAPSSARRWPSSRPEPGRRPPIRPAIRPGGSSWRAAGAAPATAAGRASAPSRTSGSTSAAAASDPIMIRACGSSRRWPGSTR
jgi:cyanophycinase